MFVRACSLARSLACCASARGAPKLFGRIQIDCNCAPAGSCAIANAISRLASLRSSATLGAIAQNGAALLLATCCSAEAEAEAGASVARKWLARRRRKRRKRRERLNAHALTSFAVSLCVYFYFYLQATETKINLRFALQKSSSHPT